MALSNTATPKYYGQFREAVLAREIPVNEEISLQMNRIDARIADPRFFYDPEPVEAWIDYCETELTLVDGTALKLLPTFKLWGEDLLCWFYYETIQVPEPLPNNRGTKYVDKTFLRRLTKKQFLIVGRGAAKSLYESCLQSYFLNCDTATTHQITTAPTMKQAEEVMQPIRTSIIRSRGPLFKLLTHGSLQNTTGDRMNRQQLVSTKLGIENKLTNSLIEVRPMTIDKLQGLRSKYNTVDEWLSGETREDVVGAIEQGASKNDNWVIVAVSSEGTVRNGVGDDIKMELHRTLRGEYPAPHVSIWHYKLDNVQEVADPNMWPKAQPNLGKTVSYETYALDVARAEANPAARNDILAKRFGLPMEGTTYFFTYQETLPHKRQTFWQQPCSWGIDLSQGDDFCAFTWLFPLPNDYFGVKTLSYISSLTLHKLQGARREKYEEFIREGGLRVLDCTILDMMEVYEDVELFNQENEYEIRAVGYDPYNAEEFIKRYKQENSEWGVEKVAQGYRTETVPLGELKTLAGERRLLHDQLIMQYAMGNAVIREDTNGNRKLDKTRYDEKIDPVSALMDAYVALKLNKDSFL